MKLARVVPLFKSGDERLFSNYSPVSVLPISSKLFQNIANNLKINYIDKLLAHNQYGFTKTHSTSSALVHLHDKITSAVHERTCTAGLLLDSFEAFDVVKQSIMLGRLEHYGIRGLAFESCRGQELSLQQATVC